MKIYKKLKPFQEVRGADLSVTICIDRYSYAKNKKSQKLTNMENKLPKKRNNLKKNNQTEKKKTTVKLEKSLHSATKPLRGTVDL